MTSTATENWAHYEQARPQPRDERWDLSELFHGPVAQPHQPFSTPHHGSFHESDGYDQNSSYIPHVKSEYVEHSYDLFSSNQPAFGPTGARAAFQESPASSSSGSSRSPTYELVSGLNPVPEDSVPQSYQGQTIAPNALGSVSSPMYPSPRQGMPPQHLSRPPQPHDHLQTPQQYQAAIPRQFDAHPAVFTPGMETMHNVFDHRFHLGTTGHPSEPDRRAHTSADYGASSPAGPYLSQYAQAPNRLAAGEQTVIVMSSRVAQKSYGNEKRFLCPPPTAVLLGHSWYTGDPSRNPSEQGSPSSSHSSPHQHPQHPHLAPSQHALATQVLISISGETNTSDGTLEWSTPAGKPIDPSEDVFGDDGFHNSHSLHQPSNGPAVPPARIGRCVGKQLYISDVDERKKRVEALVKISVTAQHGDRIEEHNLGTFTSKPIKVISKPSKKRQSAKNLELCINHGSTVSLFHRLRSQTVSTKYLCVSGSGASFKGSDGTQLPGLDPRQRSHAPSFVAKTASWDMFIIYIVDVTKPSSGPDTIVPPPFQPDYPPPPPNAIACSADNVTTPIYYNQTVVLQCLTSGVVSPVLIIRKVEQGTVIVGGGLADSSKGVPDHHCVPAEVCGDPVSQLHKIAFEVYEQAHSTPPEVGTPGSSGAFLSCMGEKVNTYRPVDVRQWPGNPMMTMASGMPSAAPSGANSLVPSPEHSNSNSPLMSSKQPSPEASPYFPPPHSVMMQNSQSSPGVYNGMGLGQPSPSDGAFDFGLDATGAARSIRRKRGSLSTAAAPSMPNLKTPSRGRKRGDSVASMTSSRSGPSTPGVTTFGEATSNAISGALWSIDVGETAVWTIVGTDQVRYNFYIPPTVVDGRSVHLLGGHNGTGHHVQPIVPSPMVHKCSATDGGAVLSLHGESFRKEDPPQIYFGTEISPVVEVRSPELIVCRVPMSVRESGSQQRWPIVLIRGDGVVYPTSFSYP